MNEKQRVMLEGLHKQEKGWEESLRTHYEKFVELRVQKLSRRRLGLLPFRDVKDWVTVDQVLAYFVRIAHARNLTKTILTIEQMLHLIVFDLLILEYRYWPSIAFDFDILARVRADDFISMPNESDALGEWGKAIVADSNLDLTPELLSNDVAPCISALRDIQFISEEISGYGHDRVVIRLIRQRPPMDLNLEGVGDAIDSLKEDIIPWRRRNAQKLAELKTQEAEAEIEKKKAEASQLRAASSKDSAEAEKISVEADSAREDVERRKLENERLRFELESSKLQLALEIVSKMRPELSDHEKLVYAFKMLPSINTLAASELELSVVEPRALSKGYRDEN